VASDGDDFNFELSHLLYTVAYTQSGFS
jgi:hypothetical protein